MRLPNLALQCAFLLSFALMLATASQSGRVRQHSPVSLPAKALTGFEVKRYLDQGDSLFVDARPMSVFVYGHIPGALSLPADQPLPSSIVNRAQSKNRTIVYCDGVGCDAAERVAAALESAGVNTVVVFPGGFQEWKSLGLPAEMGQKN